MYGTQRYHISKMDSSALGRRRLKRRDIVCTRRRRLWLHRPPVLPAGSPSRVSWLALVARPTTYTYGGELNRGTSPGRTSRQRHATSRGQPMHSNRCSRLPGELLDIPHPVWRPAGSKKNPMIPVQIVENLRTYAKPFGSGNSPPPLTRSS
jgi:hypothetical protein